MDVLANQDSSNIGWDQARGLLSSQLLLFAGLIVMLSMSWRSARGTLLSFWKRSAILSPAALCWSDSQASDAIGILVHRCSGISVSSVGDDVLVVLRSPRSVLIIIM